MVKFFINRPIFATVLALIIVVAGLVTLNILPIAQYPEITPPTVQVSAVYPGADAQTVAQTVGLPIEQQVNGVDGMLYMSSNSSSSGAYSLTITFAVGTDIDMATVMVQNRVSIAQSSLPEPVIVQGITTRKQSSNIVMMLTLSSKDSIYDGLYLSNYATLNMIDQLTRLPGVGSVQVMGAGNYSMRIWLDPEAMRIRNWTPDMVYQAISTQNAQVSAGYVGQPILRADNPYQYTLTVKGRLTTPDEFGNIVLKTGQGGKILRLKDIARIELGSSSYNVVSKLSGQPTAAIAIYQLPGSNSLDVSKVMAALGFSINTLTLFGLILAIAVVVDDAIVVVENSTRLLDTGKYTAHEAVSKAMDEIVGPIVGVVLVLLAVFIPTTFISGISGQLYKQFALTIAAATVLSGFNSLTLTPSLCALFLEKNTEEPKFFLFKGFNKVYGKTQKMYDSIVERMLKRPGAAMIVYGIITAVAVILFMRWPTTFIPEEDDGYFLVVSQLPPAASLNRTEAVTKQIDEILKTYPEVKSFISVSGFSVMGGGEQSNTATFFVILKNWNERKGKEHTAEAVTNRFNREASAIQEAQVFGMVPPAIPGLGASGGLQLQLEDRKNLGPTEMQHAVETLLASYRSKPQLLNLSCMYQANTPQYLLKIDRDKVQMLGLQLNQVFSTLSYYMGAAYVNDFVEFGRIYQVKIEANGEAQKVIDDVLRLSLANSKGEMVPFSSFIELDEQLGLDQINLYNMYSSAAITCIANPKYSSGEAILAMEELIQEQLGDNFGYEWTSVAYQETKAGSTTVIIFAMALLVAFLVLSAQYESWTSPLAAIMGLPIALLGAIIGCWVMGVPVSVYTQIGIILLIALSAKNGILIVEFARDFRKEGNPIRDSALEAGHVRLRPILMTSFAFVLGVMPLLFATGAGAASRISLGAAVVFGMAINTIFATMFIPNFYELMQTIQEKWLNKGKKTDVTPKQ